jgi:hypothetical protein
LLEFLLESCPPKCPPDQLDSKIVNFVG